METICDCLATADRPNLSGLTLAVGPGVPALLAALTVRVRVRIEAHGWRSSILAWGDDTSRGFRLYTRRAGETPADAAWDDVLQNYLSFPDTAGACDVLEAEVAFRNHNPRWNRMRVGVPAARIGKGRVHDIVLRCSGARLSLYVDGVLVDEDWPVGQVPAVAQPLRIGDTAFDGRIERVTVWPGAMADDAIADLAGGANRVARRETEILGHESAHVQYWTPRGHNQWFGDAMLGDTTGFGGERFRLFYLTDRRHGASKFGCGGHSVCQMSSADLVQWEHLGEAFALEPWETVGTGRPLVHDGRLLLFYGMHTGRIMPKDALVNPAPDADGCIAAQAFPVGTRYPQGTSFAISDDGIAFTKSHRLVHAAQNPNVCRDATGKGFLLLAGYGSKGLWHSDDLQQWRLVDQDIVPVNLGSPTRNSDECQCMFEWNGWHYIVGGRTGFWMSRNQRGPYWEGKHGLNAGVVKPRWDIYDGLWVPMVAAFGDNRRILAGFLQGPEFEWAGHLVFRELVQHGDGTLGLKWPAELAPPGRAGTQPVIRSHGQRNASGRAAVTGDAASWATLEGVPGRARLALRIAAPAGTSHIGIAILGEAGDGCALCLLTQMGRAQWSTVRDTAIPSPVPTLGDILSQDPSFIWQLQNPHVPFRGCDFAIEAVEGLQQPLAVELIVFYDPKSRSTIVDACINGERTLITRRRGLVVRTLRLFADGACDFDMIRLAQLE